MPFSQQQVYTFISLPRLQHSNPIAPNLAIVIQLRFSQLLSAYLALLGTILALARRLYHPRWLATPASLLVRARRATAGAVVSAD